MSLSTSDIVPIIIAFQSLLFAAVLLTDKGPKKISNRYLALFLIFLGTQFAAILGLSLGVNSTTIGFSICLYGFAYGPLLFMYSKSLIYKSFEFHPRQLLHFIPGMLILLLSIFGYSVCEKVGILIYPSLITYIVLAIREMINYRKVIRETQSSTDQTDLRWLQWTMLIFSFALLLDIVDQLVWSMDILGGISSIHVTILLLINWMVFKGLKQPQIFLGITESDEEVFQDKKNISTANVPDAEEQKELDHLQKFMEESDIYTNAKLNLKDLSEHLDISPRRLSYLINTFLKQNFMGFVNHYRIEKAKSRLTNPQEPGETVSEIMYEVGFNSKSSFYTIFKEKTGLTPSEYKKKHASKGV